jgi:hypothetical protein
MYSYFMTSQATSQNKSRTFIGAVITRDEKDKLVEKAKSYHLPLSRFIVLAGLNFEGKLNEQ